MGISESDFWEMSFSELDRTLSSKRRIEKNRAIERASFDYILADLVGRSIARIYSSSNKLPEITEVYPALFDAEDIQKEKALKQDELSIARLKQFADLHNRRLSKNE